MGTGMSAPRRRFFLTNVLSKQRVDLPDGGFALMDRIIEARLDELGKRIKVSPPDEHGRVGIVIDASIPACSENEAQLMAQEIQAYRSGTKFYCVGVSGGCDGELEGSSHSPHCPMYVGSSPVESTLENVESYDPKDSGNQAS